MLYLSSRCESRTTVTVRRHTTIIALLFAGALGAACSSGPSSTSTSTTSAPSGVGGWTHFIDNAPPTDLPTSCKLAPRLAPVTRTPTWPSGYQILDAVPDDLIKQFPTVFGGLVAAPAEPGESAVDINFSLHCARNRARPCARSRGQGGLSDSHRRGVRVDTVVDDLPQ